MQFLEKTMENVRNNRDIKLVTTAAKTEYLVSQPNYYTTNFFLKNILGMEMKKHIFMNKPVYLGLSILKISEIVMYGIWNDYVKPKYIKNYGYRN